MLILTVGDVRAVSCLYSRTRHRMAKSADLIKQYEDASLLPPVKVFKLSSGSIRLVSFDNATNTALC